MSYGNTIFHAVTPLFACTLLSAMTMSEYSRADEAKDASPPQSVLFDFDAKDAAERWGTVNDGVMGGRSEGQFRIKKNGVMEFYGNLSLENRGGFASVRSKTGKLDLSGSEALIMRIRGDGRSYYCNLYVPTKRIAYSYRAAFDTEAGRWQEVRLPLESFRATWFGRQQPGAGTIDAKNIKALGLLLADKKAGPFKLEIDWVGTIAKDDSDSP